MGGECSVLLTRPSEGFDCGGSGGTQGGEIEAPRSTWRPAHAHDGDALDPSVAEDDVGEDAVQGCGLCEGDSAAADVGRVTASLNGPPGLLMLDARLLATGDDGTPRTPRGPAPPWALSAGAPRIVDRTATGATPPRSPKPARATPPGLPEDDAKEAMTILSMHATFDAAFVRELFVAARSGLATEIAALLQKLSTGALSLVVGSQASKATPEQCDKAAELMASFLNKARESIAIPLSTPAAIETVLGAAAGRGHVEVVQMLLHARADPFSCDSRENTALHRAAESGRLLVVLMVLDRMQAHTRSICIADLFNTDSDTPESLAALSGSSDICRALEVFGDLQREAELRQLGYGSLASGDTPSSRDAGINDMLVLIDLLADPRSASGKAAGMNLRRAVAGIEGGLVPDFHVRISEDQAELRQLISTSCIGVRKAEEYLLKSEWNPGDRQHQSTLQAFVGTAEVRSAWQKVRQEVISIDPVDGLEDFWQTHLTSEAMVATMANARGDTFQLLLAVLWLYTREAWLRHIIEASAMVLNNSMNSPTTCEHSAVVASEGATGASPLGVEATRCARSFVVVPQLIAPLVDSLAPCMRLVQAALGWFDAAGIRHHAPTYKPLSISVHEIKQLEKYFTQRRDPGDGRDIDNGNNSGLKSNLAGFAAGTWVSLGAGTFFSTMSSRPDALRRLIKTRCNALLVIRPDEHYPYYPKQMSLRGNAVEDVLFPLGALYRVTRITKTVSSDLDPSGCNQGSSSRWPVHVIELSAADRFLDAVELLEKRAELGATELETMLQQWIEGAPSDERASRLLAGGEVLARSVASSQQVPASGGSGGTSSGPPPQGASTGRLQRAVAFATHAAKLSEASGDATAAARALLAAARCGNAPGSRPTSDLVRVAADGRRAMGLLEQSLGPNHPETCAAREAWRELGVPLKSPTANET
eukprot:TRINITY_DN1765_c0_g1_i1.p1 TRINITY_DN1765_c0_g1~~TRINITY_DN1765_c0_g1_i1.p1  ORF type:complete len:950 (+),score=123.85 TRINITY_DN1765_c0_g1_i1:51-2852(+)